MNALNRAVEGYIVIPFHYYADWLDPSHRPSFLTDKLVICLDEAHRSVAPPIHAVPRLDDPQTEAIEDDPVHWVATNLLQLLAKYPNEWIMVKNNHVVKHSRNLTELVQQAAIEGIVEPFITKMEKSTGSETAFSAND